MFDSAIRAYGLAALALGLASAALGQPSGLITVTDSHGVAPAGEIFSSPSDVNFTVGPFPSGGAALDCTDDAFADGQYVFQVTDNSGKTVLSTDAASDRVFTVAGGVLISTSGPHAISTDSTACGGSWIALSPFSRAPAGQGVYKLWVAASADVLGCAAGTPCGFTTDNSIRVNFVVLQDIRCLETHCLSGVVFEDSNGDGIRASGEPGEADVAIEAIDSSGNSVETVSGGDGTFSMCALPETSYRVIEIVPTGYRQTAPAGNRQISRYLSVRDFGYDLQFCNADFANLAFGNFPLPGSIAGTKFSDSNGNGVRDSGEPGLSGVTIHLTDAQGHAIAQQMTDAAGGFTFDNLVHGSYVLSESVPAGYRQTLPGGPGTISVELAPGENATGSDFGNEQLGRISGRKFADLNGNGIRDSGEVGLGGVTIALLAPDGSTQTTVTAADGTYAFNNLVPGSYLLNEIVPAGYRQTTPGGDGKILVTVVAGKESAGNLFGNQQLGSIRGLKFEDFNGNGVQDPEDTGISGVTITMTAPDGSTNSTVTDASGVFEFDALAPGTYVLAEDLPTGFYQTFPGGSGEDSVVVTGGAVTPASFGNRLLGGVAGVKFNDLNGNGSRDAGEPGLPGVTIVVTAADGTTTSTTTAADGTFSFPSLIPGLVTVSEVVPPGYGQTTPGGDGKIAVTVVSGQTVFGLTFGNELLAPGSISGTKFLDSNGNGVRDAGEPVLSGVTIGMAAPDGSTKSTVTAADGTFNFNGLEPGVYTLSETVPSGYQQTAPGGSGTISVTVSSGANSGGNLFGNQPSPGSISGFIFEDENKNLVQDPSEGPLGGVTVQLIDAGSAVVATTVTANDGTFLFSGIAAGVYTVHPVPPSGFRQTVPVSNKPITVDLTPGASVTGLVFGLTC